MLNVEDISDLIKQEEIDLFTKVIDTFVTDNGGILKNCVWDKDNIVRFNGQYRKYLTDKRRDLNEARVCLSAAFGEFKLIRDEVLFYDTNLISKVKIVNSKLSAEYKHILDNFDRIPFTNADVKTLTRAMIACDLKYLDETKNLCEKALVIIEQKSFKEECVKFAKDHPVVCIVGGVAVGIVLGGVVYLIGSYALSQLGTIVVKEVVKEVVKQGATEVIKQSFIYTATAATTEGAAAICSVKTAVATTCVVGGLVGLVGAKVLTIKANELSQRLHKKKIYEAEKELLVRQLAKLTEECERQKELEIQRAPNILAKNNP